VGHDVEGHVWQVAVQTNELVEQQVIRIGMVDQCSLCGIIRLYTLMPPQTGGFPPASVQHVPDCMRAKKSKMSPLNQRRWVR